LDRNITNMKKGLRPWYWKKSMNKAYNSISLVLYSRGWGHHKMSQNPVPLRAPCRLNYSKVTNCRKGNYCTYKWESKGNWPYNATWEPSKIAWRYSTSMITELNNIHYAKINTSNWIGFIWVSCFYNKRIRYNYSMLINHMKV
jgi:hypothetical protein